MTFAHVGGNLDLRGATLPGLDLMGASVGLGTRWARVHGLDGTAWGTQNPEVRTHPFAAIREGIGSGL